MCSYCTVSPLSTAAVSHIHSLCAASVSPLSSATVSVSPYIWPNPPIWLHTPSDTMCVCVLCVCCVCVCVLCVCVLWDIFSFLRNVEGLEIPQQSQNIFSAQQCT